MSQWIVCPAGRRHSARHRRVRPDRRSAVAVFRLYADEQVFAISNIDPFAQASVLSRGLIAEHQGEPGSPAR